MDMKNALPVSKSQSRAMSLLGLEASTYADATAVLESAGYEGDGVPMNETWRTAAKLSDADLLVKLVSVDGPRHRMSDVDIVEVGF